MHRTRFSSSLRRLPMKSGMSSIRTGPPGPSMWKYAPSAKTGESLREMVTINEPVFHREGDIWQAAPQAQGPFGGMHGGAVAALAVGEMEALAAEKGLGDLVSANLYLLRPLPLE